MRIAIVSDIRGDLPALDAGAADIRPSGAYREVNLGDNLSGLLLPRETAQWLMASDWLSLSSNHERQVLQLRPGHGGASDQYAHAQLTEAEFNWMRSLTHTLRLDEDVLLCHGSPRSDHEYLLETLAGSTVRAATPAETNERLSGPIRPADCLQPHPCAALGILCTHQRAVCISGLGRFAGQPRSVGL